MHQSFITNSHAYTSIEQYIIIVSHFRENLNGYVFYFAVFLESQRAYYDFIFS